MSLHYVQFKKILLASPFFDSLRNDYVGFDDWFIRKAGEFAFVSKDENHNIDGFLYLKIEDEAIEDTIPIFSKKRRVKLGTFKIDAHGTKLGDRFIRKIIDFTLAHDLDEIYVTIYDKHIRLIHLLTKYGFKLQARKSKITKNGQEGVYFKQLQEAYCDIRDYPLIKLNQRNFLLAINPQWHSRLLPDSILNNENINRLIRDVSHTNSIDKVYLTSMQGTERLQSGDNLLIYRTSDGQGPARFRSVVTSICVVKEVKHIQNFTCYEDFLAYCLPYSVFTEQELQRCYQTKRFPIILKFAYHFPLRKRVIRQDVLDITEYPEDNYWGFFPISDEHLTLILKKGKINESLIIH